MSDLWHTIAELCLELHPDRVNAIATGIGGISSVDRLRGTRDRFGPSAGKALFEKLDAAWKKSAGVSPAEVSAAFKSASAAAALKGAQGSIELVWSGPSTGVVPVRQTEEVLCEVIEGAHVSLFIVSYVAYKLDRVLRCLDAAISRGVKVEILMECSVDNGGKLTFDSMSPLIRRLPDAVFYAWQQPPDVAHHELGSVHAKCAIADGNVAFITSANLTEAAMNRNMEMGILVRGGHVPEQLAAHFVALVELGTIKTISQP